MALTEAMATALIGGGANLLGSLVNTGTQMYTQQKTWEREDNAVQRRTADLEAAGLSPTLAAGSAADSKKTDSPTLGNAVGDAVNLAMNTALGMEDLKIKEAQAEKLNAETTNIIFGNNLNDATRDFLFNQRYYDTALTNAQYNTLAGELALKYGVSPAEISFSSGKEGLIGLYGSSNMPADMSYYPGTYQAKRNDAELKQLENSNIAFPLNYKALQLDNLIRSNELSQQQARLDYLLKQNQSYWFDDVTKNVTGLVNSAANIIFPFTNSFSKMMFDPRIQLNAQQQAQQKASSDRMYDFYRSYNGN